MELKKPQEVYSIPQEVFSESSARFSQNTYNNINNNINNNTINKIISDKDSRCEDTRFAAATSAAASQISSQPLREKSYSYEEINQVQRDFKKWEDCQMEMLQCVYDAYSPAEIEMLKKTEDYKAFWAEREEKCKALRDKYGSWIITK